MLKAIAARCKRLKRCGPELWSRSARPRIMDRAWIADCRRVTRADGLPDFSGSPAPAAKDG
eukprot:8556551-Alexandrium_andersonii.AAC.1